jgi:uncharacterized protein YdaU (DUF1376 family)
MIGKGSMAEFPALPLWTDAYLGDTAHLTNEEHGVYLRLLMFAWRSPECCLPDDDKRLAIMTGLSDKKWRAIRPVIASFWTIANGAWTQKRLTKERDFVRGKSEKNRDAAKARWEAKPLGTKETYDANAMPAHMPEPCQTDAPTPIPTTSKKEDMGKPISPADKPPDKMRLPDDWALSDEGWAYARSQAIPDEVIEDEARGFHAYWTDRRDRDAKKSERGWEQCWANRCRSIAGRYKGRGMAGQASPGRHGQGGSIASIAARRWASGQV